MSRTSERAFCVDAACLQLEQPVRALLQAYLMRYLALATDYDGTLAHPEGVEARTLETVKLLRESGRRAILVTGRRMEELEEVFPEYGVFDRIVAENGAVVVNPGTHEEILLGEPPPPALVQRLRERGVEPLVVGQVVIGTWEPQETTVLQVIHELGLEDQVIFNKDAVMVLPSGINKATGLRVALADLHISPHNTVGVGDAENDHALLAECEAAVAVENALPVLKERADWVTSGIKGDGVVELMERMLATDLRELEPRLRRHDIVIGTTMAGQRLTVHPYGPIILLCGASGSSKPTLASSFLEQLWERKYQFCVVDPEGDFPAAFSALMVGDAQGAPSVEDVVSVLSAGDSNVIANLLGVPVEERAQFLTPLLARLVEHRTRSGGPHWIVVDEAHHMLPQGDVMLPGPVNVPGSLLLITVHPERLAASVLRKVDTLIVVGEKPRDALEGFARAAEIPEIQFDGALGPGEALFWSRKSPRTCTLFRSPDST